MTSTYLVLNAGSEIVLAEDEDTGGRRGLSGNEGGGGSQTGHDGGTRESHLDVDEGSTSLPRQGGNRMAMMMV